MKAQRCLDDEQSLTPSRYNSHGLGVGRIHRTDALHTSGAHGSAHHTPKRDLELYKSREVLSGYAGSCLLLRHPCHKTQRAINEAQQQLRGGGSREAQADGDLKAEVRKGTTKDSESHLRATPRDRDSQFGAMCRTTTAAIIESFQ